jgi:hypothetical protein
MRKTASVSLFVVLCVAAVLIYVAVEITHMLETLQPGADEMDRLDFELDMFKAILAGFVVSMLGILIPAVAIEARDRFEQRKQSRVAYSEAKTSVDYLKIKLSAANLAEAATALQMAHFHKHQAELYDDLPEWLKKRFGYDMTPLMWDEMMYGRLFCARKVVEDNAYRWDRLGPRERIDLLSSALPTKAEIALEKLPCWPFPSGSVNP